MGKNVSRGVMWNDAAKAGLVLGLIPVAYLVLTMVNSKSLGSHPLIYGVVAFLLWLLKFGGCIWLMVFFMRRFARERRADNKETFQFGCIVAICSALIVAAGSLANLLLVSPEVVNASMDRLIENYSLYMDSNSMELVGRIQGMLPQIDFFSNLIYCFLFGLVLSYILSRNIPPKNPFAKILEEMQKNGNGGYDDGADSDADIDDQTQTNDEGKTDMFR